MLDYASRAMHNSHNNGIEANAMLDKTNEFKSHKKNKDTKSCDSFSAALDDELNKKAKHKHDCKADDEQHVCTSNVNIYPAFTVFILPDAPMALLHPAITEISKGIATPIVLCDMKVFEECLNWIRSFINNPSLLDKAGASASVQLNQDENENITDATISVSGGDDNPYSKNPDDEIVINVHKQKDGEYVGKVHAKQNGTSHAIHDNLRLGRDLDLRKLSTLTYLDHKKNFAEAV
jgi:hypothetical protein